ncbi:MAG: thermonuclease family protein [Chloroflexi bacterium]|nr:thermonuclease family protein [Chloroflexota bacterium]
MDRLRSRLALIVFILAVSGMVIPGCAVPQAPADPIVRPVAPTTKPAAPTGQPAPTAARPQTLCNPAPAAGFLAAPSVNIQNLPAFRVTRVIDGDTIVINGGRRVRYIGVNTPEIHGKVQPFGQEATEANRALVDGKVVRLEKDVSETDKYGRLLRYVYVEGLLVNAELVRLGFAQMATYPPDVKYQDCFRALQREAREAGRGLWGKS